MSDIHNRFNTLKKKHGGYYNTAYLFYFIFLLRKQIIDILF